MTQRKLKIALSSSLADPAAIASIWLDNQVVQSNITVSNTIANPLIIEYTFEASKNHQLLIMMHNDSFDNNGNDLNLIINYVALSNEDGSYTPYTYLTDSTNKNFRTDDNANLLTETLWFANSSFVLNFDVELPITWFDSYQHDLDNP